MDKIDRPRGVVSDDEPVDISPQLIRRVDYESDLEDADVYALDIEEEYIVNNYDNYINMAQLETDSDALNLGSYAPAQILRVLNRTARTLPSGQVVLDYIVEVDGVSGADSYEVRALQL